MKNFLIAFICALVLSSCARVGSPVGGSKDTIPPTLIGHNLDTARTNISRNLRELRLDFDEYVVLDNVTKNLIISPPITKIKKILPSNLANKYVLIQWSDTLQANTTYNFNFGNAIKDNNEGNILRYFNFAFSTGEKIEDQYISGEVTNYSILKKSKSSSTGSSSDKGIVVGLYQAKDSIDYRKKPYYVTVADTDGYYEINYITPGEYKLLAFEDNNGNTLFDSGDENVAFLDQTIKIDSNRSISGKKLSLFPSKFSYKILETISNPGGILIRTQGNPDSMVITPKNPEFKDFKVTHLPKSDSTYIWFDAKEQNLGINQSINLKFAVDSGVKKDSVSLFYRANVKDEMQLQSYSKSSLLPPNAEFRIRSNFALDKLETEKWTMVSDSITQDFSARINEKNPFELLVKGDFKQGKKYSLTVPSKTVHSFYEKTAKSYRFDFEIDKAENLGESFTFILENAPSSNFWFQLLNSSDDVLYSKYGKDTTVTFEMVVPDTYSARILVDNNDNGFWDVADFNNGIHAEDVYIFDKKVTARPLWFIRETWNLKATNSSVNSTQPIIGNKEEVKQSTTEND